MNKFKKIILNNGIPLYLCNDPSMKNYFVSYNVLYGFSGLWFNFNGRKVIPGYAHYLEHLLGEHSKYGNLYDNLSKKLYIANAYTSYDVTSYHFKGREDVDKSIEELITAVDEPVFNQKDVNETRHAIEEETASYCDFPNVLVLNLVENNLYSGFDKFDETLSPIGNRKTTKLITLDDLYACYDAFYTDNNKFLVIAGNVDEKKLVDNLNEIFAKRKPHIYNLELPDIDFSGIRKQDDVINKKVDTPIMALGVKIKKPDGLTMKQFKCCLDIIERVLMFSKEYNDLNKNGVFNATQYFNTTTVSDYINYLQNFTTNKKDECSKRVLELLSRKDISNKEFELAKRCIIASTIRSMDAKYEHLEYFPQCVYYSEDYTDLDFYKSIDYDEFLSMIEPLDFSQYTVGEVKRLTRKKS